MTVHAVVCLRVGVLYIYTSLELSAAQLTLREVCCDRTIEWMVAFAILVPVYDRLQIQNIIARFEHGVPSSHRLEVTNGATMNRDKIEAMVSFGLKCVACGHLQLGSCRLCSSDCG